MPFWGQFKEKWGGIWLSIRRGRKGKITGAMHGKNRRLPQDD